MILYKSCMLGLRKGKPFLLSIFLILLFGALNVQAQNNKYDLLFQSGTVSTDSLVAKTRFKTGAYTIASRTYKIIQFTDIPTEAQKAFLTAKGIQLLQYIPNYAYYASLEAGTIVDAFLLEGAGIRVLLDISSVYKIKLTLMINDVPLEAVKEPGKVDVVVSVFENYSIADARIALSKLGELQSNPDGQLILRVENSKVAQVAALDFVYYVEPVFEEDKPENYGARTVHRSNVLNSLYSGGVGVSEGDVGAAFAHLDLTGRLVLKTSVAVDDHSAHVAGTIAGAGNLDPKMKGQAVGAKVLTYDQYNSISNIPTTYTSDGVRITSQSLGSSCMGSYDANTRSVDAQVRQYNTLFHVFSAGNSGTADCSQYPSGWGNITGGRKQSKNGITVGNLSKTDGLSSSSSRGPVSDGRIKPDICAVGSSVYSTMPDNLYASKSGTSMACPAVSGVIAQLIQAYRDKNSGADPKTGLLKSILLNSADDLGNEGPDFKYGYGRINALSAYNCFTENRYQSGTVANGQTKTHTITVPANTARMKVMVYWTDYEAASGAAKALVNDLDAVLKSGATSYYPYILNPSTTSTALLDAAATRGEDHLNNVEQIVVDNPTGTYTLEVKGGIVPQGPQEYFVVYEFLNDNITVTYPIGGEGLVAGESEYVRWDTYGTSGTFKLEYSTNNGSTWTTVSSSISGSSRYYSWTVPSTVTGKALVRISRGTKSDVSDANFSIIGVPAGLKVDWVCATSFQVSWNAVSGAESYTVYQLGSKYMDSIGTTTSLNFILPTSSGKTEYYSVNANIGGVKGRRAIAATKSGGITGCTATGTDLAVTLISTPAQNACLTGGSQSDVIVKVENKGTNTVSAYTISYSLNGGTAVTASITTALAAGQSYTHTFSQKFTVPSTSGSHSISASVNTSGDVTPGNNTATTSFNVPVTPSITITQSNAGASCPGTAIIFTSSISNGGASPVYSWKVNGTTAGSGATFTSSALQNNDVVTCVLTSNATCVASTTATSNAITVHRQNGEEHQFYIATRSLNPSMTWQIKNGATVVVNSSSVTSTVSGSNTVQNFCLAAGCYDLVVTNAFQAGGCAAAAWNSSTIYLGDAGLGSGLGEIVSYNGRQYRAQWWTQGNTPGTNSVWLDLGVCSTVYPTDVYGLKNLTTPTTHAEVQQQNYTSPKTSSFCSGSTAVTADFSANTTSAANCQSITYTATTTGTITSYSWNFGTGASPATATTAGPHTVTYSTTGQKTVSLTVNGTVTNSKTNYVTITQNTGIVPSVTIAASATTICAGSNVTFTIANQQNQGTAPTYSWKVNGVQVGTSTTFTSSSLANNDKVTLVMNSNAPCAVSPTATSNEITMNVSSSITPTISIASSATTICTGTAVTFTATASTGTIQWKLNGNNVGTGGTTYTNASLANNDKISAVLTASGSCVTAPTATSNEVTMNVGSSITPTISIASSATSICAGTAVTFTATASAGTIQWKLNGNNVGTGGTTYTNASLANNDKVSAVLTASGSCVTTPTVTSNEVTTNVSSSITPTISIASSAATICAGTAVTFTATASAGTIQWKLNGNNVGSGGTTYTNASLTNNDKVSAVLTASGSCVTAPTATSNEVVMNVSSFITPTISIASSATTICTGTSVTFTATASAGTIQWKLNGNNVGSGGTTYTNASLANSDKVSAVLTASGTCLTASTAASNQITMAVNAVVTPTISITASSTSITQGTSVTFTATASAGTIQWKLNGNNVGTGGMTYTTSTLANNDKLSAVLTSSSACASPSSVTSNIVTMTVTTAGNTVSCSDVSAWNSSAIYVVGDKCQRNGVKYEAKWWTKGNDPVTNSNTYDVWKKLGDCTAGTFGGTESLIETTPSKDTLVQHNTSISLGVKQNSSYTNVTYYLYNGSDLVATLDGNGLSFSADWNATQIGDYWLQVVVTNADNSKLYSNAVQLSVQQTTGIGAGKLLGAMEVIPNPNDGNFVLSLTELSDMNNAAIEITDMYGHTVYEGTMKAAGDRLELNHLHSGMYVIKVWNNNKVFASKFLIK